MKSNLKWLLTQLNLLLAKISPLESQAWEGFSTYGTEYDQHYRVFAKEKVSLLPGEKQMIYLMKLETGRMIQGLKWQSSNQKLFQVEQLLPTGEVTVASSLGEEPGEAMIYTTFQGKKYGIFLSVLGKHPDSVNDMYHMATVAWSCDDSFFYRPNKGTTSHVGFEIYYFVKGATYYGIPYTNRVAQKTTTTLADFLEQMVMDDKTGGVRYGKETIYNWDYPGNDCSTALGRAWNVQAFGREDQWFFDQEKFSFPATYYLLMMGANPELTRETYAVGSVVECPFNMKDGFDTRKALGQVEHLYSQYEKLDAGDGVLRFYRVALKQSGHVMMVRYNDRKEKRIYFMDQHSPTKKNRPFKSGHCMMAGQSTCSTWYSLSYQELEKYGYLPIWLNQELHK